MKYAETVLKRSDLILKKYIYICSIPISVGLGNQNVGFPLLIDNKKVPSKKYCI